MSDYFLDDGLGLPDDFNINPSDNVRTKTPFLDNSKFGPAYLSSSLDSKIPLYESKMDEIVVTANRLPNKNLKNLKRKKLLDDFKKQSQEKQSYINVADESVSTQAYNLLSSAANPTGTNLDIPLSIVNPASYAQMVYDVGEQFLQGNVLPAVGVAAARKIPFLKPFITLPQPVKAPIKKGAQRVIETKAAQKTIDFLKKPTVAASLTGYGLYDATQNQIPGAIEDYNKGEYYDMANKIATAGLGITPVVGYSQHFKFGTGSLHNLYTDARRGLQHSKKVKEAVKGFVPKNQPLEKAEQISDNLYKSSTKGFNKKTEPIYRDVEAGYKTKYPNMTDDEISYMVLSDPKILELEKPIRKLNSLQKGFQAPIGEQLTKLGQRNTLFEQHLPTEDILTAYPRLSSKEGLLLSKYTNKAYGSQFSMPLRGVPSKATPEFEQIFQGERESLNQLIQKQKLKSAQKVSREVSDFETDVYDNLGNFLRKDKFSNIKPGEHYIDKGFVSSSFEQPNFAVQFGGDIKYKLNVPKGQSAIIPNRYPGLSNYTAENELLLPTGLKFEKQASGEFTILNPYRNGGIINFNYEKI